MVLHKFMALSQALRGVFFKNIKDRVSAHNRAQSKHNVAYLSRVDYTQYI